MKKLFGYLLIVLHLLVFTSCEKKIEKELTFLSFNVWQEGTSVPNGLEKIRDVILETNPDVVCFVEVRNYNNEDWTTKLVNALQTKETTYFRGYAGGDVSFISKYPLENGTQIFSNSDKGTVVKFELKLEGTSIIVVGAHLDYTYYASNLPRGYNGGTPNWDLIDDGNGRPNPIIDIDSILAYGLKSARDEAVISFIEAMQKESKPIVLMGDFNEPSFLDWTANTKNKFDHHGVEVDWNVTKELSENGYVDAYRNFYPNEVLNPGFTWPSLAHEKKSTSWTPLADERDRLDYIFFKGSPISVLDVSIVGPKQAYVRNQIATLDTDHETFIAEHLPWPSDHKAVFAKLLFTFQKP